MTGLFDAVAEAEDKIDGKVDTVASIEIELVIVLLGESVLRALVDGVNVSKAGLLVEKSVMRADTDADRDDAALKLISVLQLTLGEIDGVL